MAAVVLAVSPSLFLALSFCVCVCVFVCIYFRPHLYLLPTHSNDFLYIKVLNSRTMWPAGGTKNGCKKTKKMTDLQLKCFVL